MPALLKPGRLKGAIALHFCGAWQLTQWTEQRLKGVTQAAALALAHTLHLTLASGEQWNSEPT